MSLLNKWREWNPREFHTYWTSILLSWSPLAGSLGSPSTEAGGKQPEIQTSASQTTSGFTWVSFQSHSWETC